MHPLLKAIDAYWDDTRTTWSDAQAKQDPDNVHELRVATRRLQASLSLLESVMRMRAASKATQRFRRLMKRLGPLRDIHVQLTLVKTWKKSETTSGFRAFLKELEREERRRVRKYLTSKRQKKIREILKVFEQHAASALRSLGARTARRRLVHAVESQRANLEAARAKALSGDIRALHELRKAAKRLRYSLEAAQSALGPETAVEIRRLRSLQGKLGRDRDVQILEKRFKTWQSNLTHSINNH